ncbi:MAG TPA: RHS repeat-associated core domain-containing protein [Gammaproteobacteria bacterium]
MHASIVGKFPVLKLLALMLVFIAGMAASGLAQAETSTITYPATFKIAPPDVTSGICVGTYPSLGAAQAACIASYPWIAPGANGLTYRHEIAGGWVQDNHQTWHIPAHYCAINPTTGICGPWSNYNDSLSISCPKGGNYEDPDAGIHIPESCVVLAGACPAGQQTDPVTNQCEAPPQRNAGTPPKCTQCVGNPINTGIGNKLQTVTDFKGGGAFPLEFTRTYNSTLANAGTTAIHGAIENLGYGWTSNVAGHLYVNPYWNGTTTCQSTVSPFKIYSCPEASAPIYVELMLWHADGSQSVFRYSSSAAPDGTAATPEPGTKGQLYFIDHLPSPLSVWTGYEYRRDDGYTEFYDVKGRLAIVRKPGGLQQVYTYDGADRLTTITDPAGRTLTFTYDGLKRVLTMKNPANGTYTFSYGTNGSISQIKYPDNSIVKYLYENTTFTRALTGITDENNNRYVTWGYNAQGQATSSEHAGGVDSFSIVYNVDGSADVTEPTGLSRHLTFTTVNMVNLITGSSAPCTECGDTSQSVSYDANGYVSSITDYNGNVTNYVHDSTGLETSRTEAYGSAQARTITTTWDTALRLPTLITEPGRTTAYTYNTAGYVLTKTVTDTVTSEARTTTYTYNAQNLIYTVDGPRTDVSDVTTYAYTPAGDLSSVTNALSQVGQITAYDSNGYPTTIVDPNGVPTALTYDLRQRLLTKTVNTTETTQFTYDLAGNLTKVTLPDGAYLQYGYDNAHRITSITDNLSNQIVYTLDNLGNRTTEQTKDPASNIVKTLGRVHDNKGYLYQIIGGMSQTTTYTDDGLGNPTIITDPMTNPTGQTFDALNRLTMVTDPASGVTTYALDALDHTTDVTDPRGLNTHYDYDAFGDVVELDSPDTGTTTYTHDLAANRLTKTNNASVTATYTYDSLNRLTSISYPDTSKNVTYTYDSGTYGKGHLTGIADASGTTTYTYDAWTNLTQKVVVEGGQTFTVGYGYDLANRLASITYPSGMVVSYTRDSTGRITTVTGNSNTVASYITYKPFGPVSGLTYGNGLVETRTYDLDYRMTGISIPSIQGLTFGYNANDDITSITDSITTTNSQTLGYDSLNQLTSAVSGTGGYGSLTYSYDADGNRTSLINGAGTAAYTIDTLSNQLQSISGATTASYSYNSIGALDDDGTNQYAYADTERLDTVTDIATSTTVATFTYNGLGQRTGKATTAGASLFVYDESGNLLGEYDSGGNLVQEHIWLDGRPIGVIDPVALYYVQTDQLNAPRAVTNASHSVMWNWNSDPFGAGMPTGGLTYNLRFPGQYYDAETGRNYNYYRDYDPGTGRYSESDPIGLGGGINTYGYAYENPVANADPSGKSPFSAAVATDIVLGGPENPIADAVAAAVYVGSAAWAAWELYNAMHSEPVLPDVNPGRDCKGNCKPCPPGIKWYVPGPGHGHPNGFWHEIKYNQDPATCMCYADRPSQGLKGH